AVEVPVQGSPGEPRGLSQAAGGRLVAVDECIEESAGGAVVAQDLVRVLAADVEAPVRSPRELNRLLQATATRTDEVVDEGAGRGMIAVDGVLVAVGDVEMAIWPKADLPRLLQAAAAGVDEDAGVGAGGGVKAGHLGVVLAGDEEVALSRAAGQSEGEAVRMVEPVTVRELFQERPRLALEAQHLAVAFVGVDDVQVTIRPVGEVARLPQPAGARRHELVDEVAVGVVTDDVIAAVGRDQPDELGHGGLASNLMRDA